MAASTFEWEVLLQPVMLGGVMLPLNIVWWRAAALAAFPMQPGVMDPADPSLPQHA